MEELTNYINSKEYKILDLSNDATELTKKLGQVEELQQILLVQKNKDNEYLFKNSFLTNINTNNILLSTNKMTIRITLNDKLEDIHKTIIDYLIDPNLMTCEKCLKISYPLLPCSVCFYKVCNKCINIIKKCKNCYK